jgi:glycosyltransferase involved in cell wall biosynthesis
MLIANTDRNQPQNNTLINSTMAAPRLLLVLTEFPPSFGGMQTHALALCHWLRQRGYEFAVATYRWEDGPMESYLYDFPVHRVLSRVAYQANLRKLEAITRQYSARLIYSSTVYYGELAGRTGRPMLCRSAGNDVLRPWIAWPFQWGSRLLDIPLVDRYLYRRWRRWQWPEALEGLLMERRFAVMRNSARSMHRIFANSEFTGALLAESRIPGSQVQILPGGVDVAYFAKPGRSRAELGLEHGVFYLLTACRLVEKKGLSVLLTALANLRPLPFPVKLLIAGDGRDRRQLESEIEAQGLHQQVRMLGYVSQEALRDYLHAADLFVLSSREVLDQRTGLRDAETMGRVLCEAAAAGRPRLATRSGGIPSVVNHGVDGWLVPEACPHSLAEAIHSLASTPELAAQLACRARERAGQEFDWPVLFAAHEAEIQNLLQD